MAGTGQTSPVEVTVTLLPEKFWARERFADRPGRSPAAKDRRYDDENEGTSILRAGREIFNGRLAGIQPERDELDRFIGIEIRFRPDLDECFRVRLQNVAGPELDHEQPTLPFRRPRCRPRPMGLIQRGQTGGTQCHSVRWC